MILASANAKDALRASVWGVLLLAAVASPAWADYKESYRKGMEAVDKGNWTEVARRMREAQAEQAKEGEKLKLYGMRFEPYLPSYYLGLALYNTGDCAGALTAFSASEGQGAVQQSSQAKLLVKYKATCEAKVGQNRPPEPRPSEKPTGPDPAAVQRDVRTAEASVSSADEQAREVSSLAGDPALAGRWAQDPALGNAQKQASELLASARTRLDAGRRKPDLAQLAEANDLASRAASQFAAVKQTANIRREEARRAGNDTKPPDTLKTTPSSTGPVATSPVAPTGPPEDLVNAARAYFNGQYREAAASLSHPSYAGKSGAQAMLFRAASRYALYVLGGEKDVSLKSDAQSDVQACRRLSPGFAPDSRYFSPRFTAFFKAAQ